MVQDISVDQSMCSTRSNKARILPDKKLDSDIVPSEITVVANFYKDQNQDIIAELPRLPYITSPNYGDADDYESYPNKMSSWFENTKKPGKKQSDKPPNPKKRYYCIKCEWSFDTGQQLFRHKIMHRTPGSFACQVCLTLFAHAFNTHSHWRSICPQITKSRSDIELSRSDMSEIRNFVLCAMGMANRAQQYHVLGGIIFFPSPWFLKDKYNIIDTHYQRPCHLCHVTVPDKFLECHGDVHRGRFRIDGRIYGDFFCHICGQVFQLKQSLIEHWRFDCPELMNYTPEDIFLDDEEMAAIAWLFLQSTISQDKIIAMAGNTMLTLERWARDHAKKYGFLHLLDRYYHYPQEIWPLKLKTGMDILNDSIPIMGPNAFLRPPADGNGMTLNNPVLPVHATNLLATVCPVFYATGAVFTEIIGANEDPKEPKKLHRILMRYTTTGSIIDKYKISIRTCPILRSQKINGLRRPEYYNIEKPFFPKSPSGGQSKSNTTENALYSKSWTCHARFDTRMEQTDRKENICDICMRIVGIRSLKEHWTLKCVPLRIIFPEAEDRMCVNKTIALQIKNLFKKHKTHVTHIWVHRPKKDKETESEPAERIGERRKIHVEYVESAMKNIRQSLAVLIEESRKEQDQRRELEAKLAYSVVHAVICPHCGGRINQVRFFSHLENRHFYDTETKKICREDVENWKNGGCSESYKLLETIIPKEFERTGRSMLPLIPKETYNKACEAHKILAKRPTQGDISFNDPSSTNAYDPWTENPTTRSVVLDKPLALCDKVPKRLEKSVVTLERKKKVGLEVYFPETTVADNSSIVNQSQEGDEYRTTGSTKKMKQIENKDYKDIITGEELPADLIQIRISQDKQFFGDTQEDEARKNRLNIKTIGEFYQQVELCKEDDDYSSSEQEEEDGLEKSDDENEDDEGDLSPDEEGKPKKKKRKPNPPGQSDDDDDDEEDDEDDENNDDDNCPDSTVIKAKKRDGCDPDDESEEAMKERNQVRQFERRKHKEMSLNFKGTPEEFNETQFAKLSINVDPSKLEQLKYLTRVESDNSEDSEDSDNDGDVGDGRNLLAFSMAYENSGDFLQSALHFNKHCKEQLPPKQSGHLKEKLTRLQKSTAIDLDNDWHIDQDGPPDAVRDKKSGTIYIGGYVRPMEKNEHDDLKSVYLTRGEYARQFKIFNCEDKKGHFKFYWPMDKITIEIAIENYREFERVEMVDADILFATLLAEHDPSNKDRQKSKSKPHTTISGKRANLIIANNLELDQMKFEHPVRAVAEKEVEPEEWEDMMNLEPEEPLDDDEPARKKSKRVKDDDDDDDDMGFPGPRVRANRVRMREEFYDNYDPKVDGGDEFGPLLRNYSRASTSTVIRDSDLYEDDKDIPSISTAPPKPKLRRRGN